MNIDLKIFAVFELFSSNTNEYSLCIREYLVFVETLMKYLEKSRFIICPPMMAEGT